ncbi:hypothetical protein LAZ67_4004134 [Cordylochernes scorpioides]|uniref:Uncharacterized protein n=1 Tax=Cordylochernes scorpioides TaxID=51811 RepID=A0ABY6KIY8_9ARAC|nr:hypothetical protein LAZ67_4004134 [Cordylochernes scorpioides]
MPVDKTAWIARGQEILSQKAPPNVTPNPFPTPFTKFPVTIVIYTTLEKQDEQSPSEPVNTPMDKLKEAYLLIVQLKVDDGLRHLSELFKSIQAQDWVFGRSLDEDTLAILTFAKTCLYKYFLGVELWSEDLVWRRTLSRSHLALRRFYDGTKIEAEDLHRILCETSNISNRNFLNA